MRRQSANMNRPTVVIVGAGFAGINAAQALRGAPVQVVMVELRTSPIGHGQQDSTRRKEG